MSIPMRGHRTISATQRAVQKWVQIAKGEGKDHGWRDCSLCQVNLNIAYPNGSAAITCANCPVGQATERTGCKGSPYDQWESLANAQGIGMLRESCGLGVVDFRRPSKAMELALAEAHFLNDLLPVEARLSLV